MKAAIFDGWRKAHPQWTVVEKAEVGTGADMMDYAQGVAVFER